MFELSDFYQYCRQNDVDVIPFLGAPSPGVTMADRGDYCVFLDFSKIHSTRLLKGICCHELGHVATGALHNVDSPFELVERSEYRANRWGYQHFLTREDFSQAFAAGYRELWELADFFDLPEQDIKKALTYWSEQKGAVFSEWGEDFSALSL